MELKYAVLDSKRIAYCSETLFIVQVGKGKSAYKNRYTFQGNFAAAIMHYNAINCHSGYKKRLYMPSCSIRPVIARYISKDY